MLKQTIKYTTVLPQDYINELREMADKKLIPSINQGIRVAVEDFIKARTISEYKYNMLEASKDETFNRRLTDTMTAFEYTDAKVDDEW